MCIDLSAIFERQTKSFVNIAPFECDIEMQSKEDLSHGRPNLQFVNELTVKTH